MAVHTGTHILKLNFKQGRNFPDGQATLIDFKTNKIYYLVYYGDQILRKAV